MEAVLRREEPKRLQGQELLARLRGEGTARPAVDPGDAAGLREWLEDSLAEAVAALGDGARLPVLVTKDALTQVLTCEAHLVARRHAPRQVTAELARGALVDVLFRQWVTVGRVDDPFADGLAALEADGDRDGVAGFVASLPPDRRHALVTEVTEHAARITTSWPVPSAGFMARTQERLYVPVAGGRVVLSGVLDLALGAPSAGEASVCVVEVKSGRRRVEHRGDLHFYALIETLRSGAPPFRVATYYTATGELDVEAVGRDAVVGALHRVVAGTVRLCRLAGGEEPARAPNPLCAWCSALPDCRPGQDRVRSGGPRSAADDDPWDRLAVDGRDDEEEAELWASR